MPAPDLETMKVTVGETSSPTKFNSLVQAVEDEFSDVDPDQISGYPASAAKYLRGDGTWPELAGLQTYTPTWTSTGTQPALGNGTIAGRFFQIGKLVRCSGTLEMGSTTTFGTGNYTFSLPVAVSASMPLFMAGEMALLGDVSTGGSHAGWAYLNSSTVFAIWTVPVTGGASNVVSNTFPFTWASGDFLRWVLTYEAA